MSVFTSLGILLISALIVASLELVPGVFAIFHHYASGKYSARKVDDLSVFFVLGAETLPAIVFVMFNFVLGSLAFTNLNLSSNIFPMVIAGLLLSLSIVFLLFYFRKGRNTKLFISRKTAKNFDEKARTVKTRSDAFTLGFIAGIPELVFTLPLYGSLAIEISKNFIFPFICAPLLLIFILLTISPLFFLCAYFKNNNLADFIRLRIKNKSFYRFFIPLLYFLLALLIIIFRTSL